MATGDLTKALAEIAAMPAESQAALADWKAQAHAIIGPQGARAAIDSVGGKLGGDLCDLLGNEGLLVVFGTATRSLRRRMPWPITASHTMRLSSSEM